MIAIASRGRVAELEDQRITQVGESRKYERRLIFVFEGGADGLTT